MTATTTTPQTTPTSESIQQALEFLRNLADQKSTSDDAGKTDSNSLVNSNIFKTIEDALKNSAEMKAKAKAAAAPLEDGEEEEEENDVECAEDEEDYDEDNDDDEDNEDEEDNPFAGDYYWSPGPEWKTIGLVAGGAALVGLGALLHKLMSD